MSTLGNQANRQTWDRVLQGDVAAYQQVVESHQSAVSAVAYAIVGDFPISQDIAQETFWVAWTKRNSLRDVRRLGAWLCGIARNLARQWRRQHRKAARTSSGELPFEPAAVTPEPIQQSIAEEEQRLVWSALSDIPESYREVLTLYYRQGKSIAEVAVALDLSEDAARQRLSRGRSMLRGRVSSLIEGVLDRSKPDHTFAARVIAGLTGAGMAAKTGTAAASTFSMSNAAVGAGSVAAKGVLATGAVAGTLGGILGAVGGLAGGFLGTWIPAQLAPTETERQLIMDRGRITMGLAIIFTVAVLAWSLGFAVLQFEALWFVAGLLVLSIAFMVPVTLQMIRLSKLINQLRAELPAADDPNQSALAQYGKRPNATFRRGRRYSSEMKILGLPLLDVQFADIDFSGKPTDKLQRGHARGWIALGDRATGVLFAMGGLARGFIAIGGVSMGVISLGGVALGLATVGGLALGMLAIGGAALGYDAAGGLAIGWHSAAAGLAIAWHAAFGGMAVAREFAVGGAAYASEANTLIAEEIVSRDSLTFVMDWPTKHTAWFVVAIGVISFAPAFMMRWVYSQPETSAPEAPAKKS